MSSKFKHLAESWKRAGTIQVFFIIIITTFIIVIMVLMMIMMKSTLQ